MKYWIYSALIFFVSCASLLKQGRLPANIRGDLVGIEATFTNELLQNHQRVLPNELDGYLDQVANRIKENCPQCDVSSYMGTSYETEYRVTLPSGVKLNLGRDQRVIEVTADPLPRNGLVAVTEEIQSVLYEATKFIGLRPAKHTGGGHLHFDMDGFFQGNPQLLRDFMVDYYNNQMVLKSFLGGEVNNAPVINDLPTESQKAFKDLISDFDKKPFSIAEFIQRMESEVYNQTYRSNFSPTEKYQAISFIHSLKENGTVEFRAIRPYKRAEHIALISEVLLRRRDFLIAQREIGKQPVLLEKPLVSGPKAFSGMKKFLSELGMMKPQVLALFPVNFLKPILQNLDESEKEIFKEEFLRATAFDDKARINEIQKSGVWGRLTQESCANLLRSF